MSPSSKRASERPMDWATMRSEVIGDFQKPQGAVVTIGCTAHDARPSGGLCALSHYAAAGVDATVGSRRACCAVSSNAMKVYEVQPGSNTLDGLKRGERPEPKPDWHQLLVRVRATSINYRDRAVLLGQYFTPVERPTIPLSDGAGEVVAI